MASDLQSPVNTDFPPSIRQFFRRYITPEEEIVICKQMEDAVSNKRGMVLWSGIDREDAEAWAAKHKLHTLASAMGPLMHPRFRGSHEEKREKLRRYMRGASAVFTWYAARCQTVVVLTPPPPQRFHPSGYTNLQVAEAPIIAECARLFPMEIRVILIHPTVEGAEDIWYQVWPIDETDKWIAQFGANCVIENDWRSIKTPPGRPCLNDMFQKPNTVKADIYMQLVKLFTNASPTCRSSEMSNVSQATDPFTKHGVKVGIPELFSMSATSLCRKGNTTGTKNGRTSGISTIFSMLSFFFNFISLITVFLSSSEPADETEVTGCRSNLYKPKGVNATSHVNYNDLEGKIGVLKEEPELRGMSCTNLARMTSANNREEEQIVNQMSGAELSKTRNRKASQPRRSTETKSVMKDKPKVTADTTQKIEENVKALAFGDQNAAGKAKAAIRNGTKMMPMTDNESAKRLHNMTVVAKRSDIREISLAREDKGPTRKGKDIVRMEEDTKSTKNTVAAQVRRDFQSSVPRNADARGKLHESTSKKKRSTSKKTDTITSSSKKVGMQMTEGHEQTQRKAKKKDKVERTAQAGGKKVKL